MGDGPESLRLRVALGDGVVEEEDDDGGLGSRVGPTDARRANGVRGGGMSSAEGTGEVGGVSSV
jgi:hypothetical protein